MGIINQKNSSMVSIGVNKIKNLSCSLAVLLRGSLLTLDLISIHATINKQIAIFCPELAFQENS